MSESNKLTLPVIVPMLDWTFKSVNVMVSAALCKKDLLSCSLCLVDLIPNINYTEVSEVTSDVLKIFHCTVAKAAE